MRVATDLNPANTAFPLSANPAASNSNAESRFADYKIIRRNGSVAPFQPDKIAIALTKAFLAVNGGLMIVGGVAMAIAGGWQVPVTRGAPGSAALTPAVAIGLGNATLRWSF